VVDANTIKLAESEDDALADKAIDVTGFDDEDPHSIERTRTLTFEPAAEVDAAEDTITFADEHYLETGANVVYRGEDVWRLTGLEEGQTYYVGALDEFTIQLFKTAAELKIDNPKPIDLTYDASAEGSGITFESTEGNVSLASANSSYLVNLAVGAQGADSFAIGGSVGVNVQVNTTESAVSNDSNILSNDSNILAGKDILLDADDLSVNVVFAGSVQGSKGGAVGAAVAVDTLVDTVSTRISDSDVDAGRDVVLDSDMLAVVANVAAGGGLAQQFAAGGSIAVTTVVDTTQAVIERSSVTAVNDVQLSSTNTSVIVGVAGSAQGSKGGAVGAAIAVNTIVDTVSTRVADGSEVTAGGDVSLDSGKTTVLASLAVSGQIAETFTAGASVGVNVMANKTEALASGSIIEATSGDISITASDTSVTGSLVGSVSGSRGASIGAAVAVNVIGRFGFRIAGRFDWRCRGGQRHR